MHQPANSQPYLLVVEDNPADARLVQEALASAGIDVEFEHVLNGEEGLNAVAQVVRRDEPPRAVLVLLDLGLPGIGGLEVLRQFKQFPTTRCIPVVVFSSDDDPLTVKRALERHANAYLHKQRDLEAYMASVSAITKTFLHHACAAPG